MGVSLLCTVGTCSGETVGSCLGLEWVTREAPGQQTPGLWPRGALATGPTDSRSRAPGVDPAPPPNPPPAYGRLLLAQSEPLMPELTLAPVHGGRFTGIF